MATNYLAGQDAGLAILEAPQGYIPVVGVPLMDGARICFLNSMVMLHIL